MFLCNQRIGIEHKDELVKAIEKYPKAFSGGVSFFGASSIFAGENFPAFYKKMAKVVKEFKERGIEVSVNISTIGHSDAGVGGTPVVCEKMFDSYGKGCIASACPRGEKFIKLLKESVEYYAKLSPKAIWIDDDFRLSFHAPVDYGCFCDDCIKKFNIEKGLNLGRDQLRNAILNGDIIDGKNVRLLWQGFNRDAMVNLAKVIADSVHANDPKVVIGFMQINPEIVPYEIPDYQRINEVAKNVDNEVYYRHGSGFYSDFTPYEMIEKSVSIGRLCSLSKSDKYKVLNYTEEVTVPYQRRGKSMKLSVMECALNVAFSGADGTMDEAISSNPKEQFKAGNIVPTMHEKNDYLSVIKDLVSGKKQRGVYPYYSIDLWSYNDEESTLKDMKDLGASDWINLSYSGVPITFDENSADVLLLSGKTVRAIKDDELKYWLSRGIYADGTSAVEINKRLDGGTGVKDYGEPKTSLADRENGERFTDHELNGLAKGRVRKNLAQAISLNKARLSLDGATALSFSENVKEEEKGLIGTAVYENRFGGRIAVNARGPWDQDILSDFKTDQIKNVFDWLSGGKMPIRLENTCRVISTVWEDQNERVVFLFNTDYDDEINAKLIIDGVYKAEILKEDLSWELLGESDEIIIPKINAFETAVIRLKK